MHVEILRRYPVKSMLGEELAESVVSERGLAGDRARAVLDVATGKIASAKNPRLWRRLLTLEGARVPGDAELSELLGREVRVIDVPPEGAELERSVPERVLAEGIEAEVPYTVGTLGGRALPRARSSTSRPSTSSPPPPSARSARRGRAGGSRTCATAPTW
ncbi:MOSC N-terminal beta barrel domain-containing protein [Nonomuraea salmonea]|uniref:MOSC N-terminal beta barrel domain-containing protein n=1 Tax=Nonomuraea salmonea TaxID=46181 RepID=UPI002FEA7434